MSERLGKTLSEMFGESFVRSWVDTLELGERLGKMSGVMLGES